MKKFILINGKTVHKFKAVGMKKAIEVAENTCDHSEEVILREYNGKIADMGGFRIHLDRYNWNFYKVVNQYLIDKDVDGLINRLLHIQTVIQKYTECDNEIWFRLHEYDTLVTTIQDIKTDLSLPKSHANYVFMNERLGDCVYDASVRIYND